MSAERFIEVKLGEMDRDRTCLSVAGDKTKDLSALLKALDLPFLVAPESEDADEPAVAAVSADTWSSLRALVNIHEGKMFIYQDVDALLDAEFSEQRARYEKRDDADQLAKGTILQNMCTILSGGLYRTRILPRDGGIKQSSLTYLRSKEDHPDARTLEPAKPGAMTGEYSKKFLQGTFEDFFSDVDSALLAAGIDPVNADLGNNSSAFYKENRDRLYEAYKALRHSGYGAVELTAGLS